MGSSEVDVIERLVVAGVAITTRALAGVGGYDLTFPQWRVLVVLGDAGAGGATVSEVASRIGVTVPATSRQLRRLQTRLLVTLESDEMDRRAIRAKLTRQGAHVRKRIFDLRRSEVARAVAGVQLDGASLEQLSVIAAAMANHAEK